MFRCYFTQRNVKNIYNTLFVFRNCFISSISDELVEHNEKFGKDIVRYRNFNEYKSHFIENLFLGIFEPEVLEYPEIRTLKEVDYLKKHGQEIYNLMLHDVRSPMIDSSGKNARELLGLLQEKNVIGMKIKHKENGLGYLESESSFITECLATDASTSKLLSELENSGYTIINLFANSSLKDEYLPKVLNGECVPCLAHLENDSSVTCDNSPITTRSIKLEDGSYSISGRKTLVYNPDVADVIIVSAATAEAHEDSANNYTLFLVDKNSSGVSVLEPLNKIGLPGIEICDVVFDKVIVTEDKIVGKVNEGSVIIKKLLSQGKLCHGAQCIGLMRRIINDAIEYCIDTIHFNKPLFKFKYIQGVVGELVSSLYAAESMMYLMTGRIDSNNFIDVKLESLIVKIFTSEAMNFTVKNMINCIGKNEIYDEEFISKLLKDCHFFSAFDDPNNYLKEFLTITGINYVLKQKENRTVKGYKPKSSVLLYYLEKFPEAVKTSGELYGFLHGTLKVESQALEYCVSSLNFLTELLLYRCKNDFSSYAQVLNQLSELLIIIYKLAGVLGRASRSYCIGLRHSEVEILIARNITTNSFYTVRGIVKTVLKLLKEDCRHLNSSPCILTNGKLPALPLFQLGREKVSM